MYNTKRNQNTKKLTRMVTYDVLNSKINRSNVGSSVYRQIELSIVTTLIYYI